MSDPDRSLARRARKGDAEALLDLYERHRRSLFGFLTRAARDRALAEDLFQEVWMKVIEKINQFEPERGTFRGWIFRIAANGLRDSARRAAVRRGPELDAPLGPGRDSLIDHTPSLQPDPERGGASLEALRALEAALGGLPPLQAAAVLLRHQQGMSYMEIADAIEVPVGTAKSMVHRGLAALREALPEWADG